MNNSPKYRVIITDYFSHQFKKLAKKDAKLIANLREALRNFSKHKAIFIGSKVYKIRIVGQGKGKSGGYRVYLLLLEINGVIAPVHIYSKNSTNTLTIKEITYSLQRTKEELVSFL